MSDVRKLVDEQAEDEGLWFIAATAPEAYLQQELRRLHAAIEGDPCPSCNTYAPWHRVDCAAHPPDKKNPVILCEKDWAPHFEIAYYEGFETWWENFVPTHWMPKPEGPREG